MMVEDKKDTDARKMRTIGDLKLTVNPGSAEDIASFAAELAKEQGYGEQRIDEMRRAFREIGGNIFTYAFHGKSGTIEAYCTLDRVDRMVFKIIDTGDPFNLLLAGDPLFAGEYVEQGIPQPSARLTKRFCETVEYQRLDNKNYLFVTFSRVAKEGVPL